MGLFGQCLLDLSGLFPDVFGDVDPVEGRFELLLHPGTFLDVPGRVQHLQFGDAADAPTRARIIRGSSSSRTRRQVEPGQCALVGEVAGHPHICSSAPGSRRKSNAPDSPRATRSRTAAMRITSRNAALMVSRMDSVPRIPALCELLIDIDTGLCHPPTSVLDIQPRHYGISNPWRSGNIACRDRGWMGAGPPLTPRKNQASRVSSGKPGGDADVSGLSAGAPSW